MTIRLGLVDDHPVVIGGLEAGLNEIPDFEVVARAGRIAEAEAMLARQDIDVVLLDVRLSDGNTLQLLGRLDRGPRPAVIVLSSFRTSQYVGVAIKFGAQGFLLKTTPIEELVDAIRRVAAGGSSFTAEQLRAGRGGYVSLTERERDVLRLVLAGHTNDEISVRLHTSRKTIESHLSRLYERYGVMSRLELGLRAEREGWLDVDPG
jgi:DNA-binding NarL/FixJ family response regulator